METNFLSLINRNFRIARLYMNKLRLEISFSWLSTLGGACATLGDKYKNFVCINNKKSIKNVHSKVSKTLLFRKFKNSNFSL